MTKYAIVQQMTSSDQEQLWAMLGTVEASSSRAALGEGVKEFAVETPATLAAIPVRSWRPAKVEPHERPQVKVTF